MSSSRAYTGSWNETGSFSWHCGQRKRQQLNGDRSFHAKGPKSRNRKSIGSHCPLPMTKMTPWLKFDGLTIPSGDKNVEPLKLSHIAAGSVIWYTAWHVCVRVYLHIHLIVCVYLYRVSITHIHKVHTHTHTCIWYALQHSSLMPAYLPKRNECSKSQKDM